MKAVVIMRCLLRLFMIFVLVQGAHTTTLFAMVGEGVVGKILLDDATEAAEHAAAARATEAGTLKVESAKLVAEQKPGLYKLHADSLNVKYGEPRSGPITETETAALRIKLKRFPKMSEEQAVREIVWERSPAVVEQGPRYTHTTYVVDPWYNPYYDPFFGPPGYYRYGGYGYGYDPFLAGMEFQAGVDIGNAAGNAVVQVSERAANGAGVVAGDVAKVAWDILCGLGNIFLKGGELLLKGGGYLLEGIVGFFSLFV